MVTNVLEDAKLSEKTVYALWIDFSSAFNTVDHDKLLQIMYDLGFPRIAIEAVKSIYSNAKTRVLTPYGPTDEFSSSAALSKVTLCPPFFSWCF
jgi:hypothetical protein